MKKINIKTNDKSRFYKKYYSDAAYDIIHNSGKINVPSKGFVIIPLNLQVTVSDEYYIQLQHRSSIARKGILVETSIIDGEYEGEISVVLFNMSDEDFEINDGDRVVSISVHDKFEMEFHEITRGNKNNGSTNV